MESKKIAKPQVGLRMSMVAPGTSKNMGKGKGKGGAGRGRRRKGDPAEEEIIPKKRITIPDRSVMQIRVLSPEHRELKQVVD
jgi:hypothetical protein